MKSKLHTQGRAPSQRHSASPPERLLTVVDAALPEKQFARLRRRVQALGSERLRQTYQTTFWFDLGQPSNVVEQAARTLASRIPTDRRWRGVEWWLSRMRATDVQVDFHQDRDNALALASGRTVHPRYSSVLFLNRVRGGQLAVTREPTDEQSPARAPRRHDFALAQPRPNRFVYFLGELTHGVLDAHSCIPTQPLREPARLRLAVIFNWWHRRPRDVPSYAESGRYRALADSVLLSRPPPVL